MILMLGIVGVAYYRRAQTLRGDARRAVPGWRQVCFWAAIVVLVAEPISPLGYLDERSFTVHMLEHLVIGDLAALLMVLGMTGPLLAPLLRNPVIELLRPLTLPVPSFVLWVANLYFWHIPFAFNGALTVEWVHVIQHICFFSFGFNVWMTLFGPLPQPSWFGNTAKIIFIALQRMAAVALGNFFIFSGSLFYDAYANVDDPFGMTPLGDQITAGSVMMVEGTVVSFAMLGYFFFRGAIESEASQRLQDHARAHGVEISRRRADRAAAAGTTQLLYDRIAAGEQLSDDHADEDGLTDGGITDEGLTGDG